ncbi:phosphonate metabolism protein/1,5-bisphosphokinase (PRPP-forming) PhnN [Jannaschia sp. LMIT008]|uniref:phosphonate metabolism protein/1,5-bisphosphokinase (PRPP-forming) PhnN n=1 Tax=Jannaschia maritima TaxID=3032585 RepID=UPI002810AC66|nr:phosphonate metabolism protein/1,5-bisphosphokinase (PRPP-forming) PhnN [Jannaschia sp. LMIT008]
MSGLLIAVVGPSGVGKDSVIRGLVDARPEIGWVRRAITRPPSDTEPFESVSEAEFDRRAASGAFGLHWKAHGLRYGVPTAEIEAARAGAWRVVNLSRGVLAEADALAPLKVLSVTARPETIAARLSDRGREGAQEIARRLARRRPLPAGLDVTLLPNDGPLDETVAAVLAALPQPVRG